MRAYVATVALTRVTLHCPETFTRLLVTPCHVAGAPDLPNQVRVHVMYRVYGFSASLPLASMVSGSCRQLGRVKPLKMITREPFNINSRDKISPHPQERSLWNPSLGASALPNNNRPRDAS